jgi:hypothetical protein
MFFHKKTKNDKKLQLKIVQIFNFDDHKSLSFLVFATEISQDIQTFPL